MLVRETEFEARLSIANFGSLSASSIMSKSNLQLTHMSLGSYQSSQYVEVQKTAVFILGMFFFEFILTIVSFLPLKTYKLNLIFSHKR